MTWVDWREKIQQKVHTEDKEMQYSYHDAVENVAADADYEDAAAADGVVYGS